MALRVQMKLNFPKCSWPPRMNTENVICVTDLEMRFLSHATNNGAKESTAQLAEWSRLDAGEELVVQENLGDQRAGFVRAV